MTLEATYSVNIFEMHMERLSHATILIALSAGLRDPTLFSEFSRAIEASLQAFGLIDQESATCHELEALLDDLWSIERATR